MGLTKKNWYSFLYLMNFSDGYYRAYSNGFRGTAENAKTKLCMRWANGECRFGDKCNFAHGENELRYPKGNGRSSTLNTGVRYSRHSGELVPSWVDNRLDKDHKGDV